MTRRKRTKAMREFQIVSRTENEDGTANLDIRVKNRPGRRHGGPLWNQIPYPMSVQERVGQQAMDQGIIKPEMEIEVPEDVVQGEHYVAVQIGDIEVDAPRTAEFLAKIRAREGD